MKEKWVVSAKKADFQAIGQHFGIDQVLARIMRNRGLTDLQEMDLYLHGTRADLHDPHLLKDVEPAARILKEKIEEKKHIRIIGDYDIDGIQSTYILYCALRRLDAVVDFVIPDRILDGYGLNEHLVTRANADGVDTILTCDNGISAIDQIHLAKTLGMTVVVTDHHEVPFTEVDGVRREKVCEADAVVNPKQQECRYPFKKLCGAAVAFKLVQVLYEVFGLDVSEADCFIENAGFATVGDVMDLQGENRILVKLGLEMLNHTTNIGMKALILQNKLTMGAIKSHDIGFRIGPCLNASGRLDTARLSLKLLLCESETEAAVLAEEIVELNESRKLLTMHAVEQAKEIAQQEEYVNDRVLVIFLPDCHESLAGIVAGRIREAYHRPTLVITRSEHGAKGSGRSIESYSMYEELCKCEEYLTQFGGHPMAAGFSLKEADIDVFRRKLNAVCTLTEEDLRPKVVIDVPMPISYITERLVNQLTCLEPFGKGNEKPVFADRNLVIERLRICGKEGRVFQMKVRNAAGVSMDAVYFGDSEDLLLPLEEKYGKVVAQDTLAGRCIHEAALHFTYYPEMDHYYETPRIKLRLTGVSA
ncbi:single-stranded-DNA-specific exonuclease RecJ [uncultured Eubacterium sp.]|uniref:single-stranded-DNA-specific exonuclease RecJ n=1 Tax=uncultured Eubacterium sp. TaxID=165185 RepID=UPI0025EAA2A4|nr:single-stranded-DNA-specific exonuclease RecJ [uncultured Eubacterium sp.]MCI6536947.1 single-stranded-DNA-specific exonuclease RecJ [Lachnospiraceae bacterium]